jgi:hypothetical protein
LARRTHRPWVRAAFQWEAVPEADPEASVCVGVGRVQSRLVVQVPWLSLLQAVRAQYVGRVSAARGSPEKRWSSWVTGWWIRCLRW